MRKVIAFILATTLLLSGMIPASGMKYAFAATGNAGKVIKALEIMETDKGTISTDTSKITRAQYAQLLVNLSGQKDEVAASSNISLFKDVSRKYWAAGYIKTAVTNNWMSGYLDGSFQPNKGITLMEAINGILRLLGYSDSDFSGNLTENKLALYKSKELNKNVTVTKTSSYLSYDNCINLFYNTLKAKTKDGKVYAETLGYSLDSDGELNYLSLINTGTEGPIIADDSWTTEIPFPIYSATFYKNDTKCTYTDIKKYDVIYYSEASDIIWAYDTKVTGVISAINPDMISPTSITVAGVEYQFETSAASLEFSSLGSVEKGDIITLLLGKNGAIAGVLSLDEYNTTVTGVVLSTDTHTVQNSKGEYINTGYVTYVDPAGNKYSQDYDTSLINFTQGDLIRITYKDGNAAVAEISLPTISFNNATVNSTGMMLGTVRFSSNIQILDYHDGTYTSIYPIRLANMIIQDSKIIYYDTNVDGEITSLILDNATGDIDNYGIFTGYAYSANAGVYQYIIDGKAGTLSKSSYSSYTSEKGPAGFTYMNGSISGSYSLTKVNVTSIGTTTITSGSVKYPLAEKVGIYYLSDNVYTATTIDMINLSKYRVTAYYDRAITLGGRVRVLIAESID